VTKYVGLNKRFYVNLHLTIIQGDFKRCERLHHFIGKKIITTQKFNSRRSKEQSETFFSRMRNSVSLIFVWLLLSYK
jgi:hypothetical protein